MGRGARGRSAHAMCMRSPRADAHELYPAWGWLAEPILSIMSAHAWVGVCDLGPTWEHAWVGWRN
jgi:hypothetical protein